MAINHTHKVHSAGFHASKLQDDFTNAQKEMYP
jgi:hypothetical protein